MAKKKKGRRRQGLCSKIANALLVGLTFARPIQLILSQGASAAMPIIIKEATFGLSDGAFDLNAGLRMYTPAGAALALGKLKGYAMRHFPVR